MKRLLLVLLLCGSCWAANDFACDPNCVLLWRFENGALETDSIGTNTLTNTSVTSDTSIYVEGAGSAYWNNSPYFQITDANLDTGVPFKSSNTDTQVTFAFWCRFTSHYITTRALLYKAKASLQLNFSIVQYAQSSKSTIRFNVYKDTSSYNGVSYYRDASDLMELATWYHVTCTFDDATDEFGISIWDAGAGNALGNGDISYTPGASFTWFKGNDLLNIGVAGPGYNRYIGWLDEVVVFNDILTPAEMAAIIAGTFSCGSDASTDWWWRRRHN